MATNGKLAGWEETLFWRQLAALLAGGIALPAALLAIGKDASSPALTAITAGLAAAVADGEPLSRALERHGRFAPAAVATVRAGERSGDLAASARVLAAYGEKTELMALRGRMVLTYPAILLVATLLVSSLLAAKMLPSLQALYPLGGAELPATARAALAVLSLAGYGLVLVPLAALAGFVAYRSSAGARRLADRLLLALPFWSRYYRALLLARFSRTLCLLLDAGVPLGEALDLAAGAAGKPVLIEEVHRAARAVDEGGRAGTALSGAVAFTPAAVWALKLAEERGDLAETAAGLADYFDETAGIGAATVLTALEPLAVAAVGLIAAFAIVTLYYPTVTMIRLIP